MPCFKPDNHWFYFYPVPEFSPTGRVTVEQKLAILEGDPRKAEEIDHFGHELDIVYFSVYGKNGLYPDGKTPDGSPLPLYLRDQVAYETEMKYGGHLPFQMDAYRARRRLETALRQTASVNVSSAYKADDSVDQFGPGAHKPNVVKPKDT